MKAAYLLDECGPSKEDGDPLNMDNREETIFQSLEVVCWEVDCQEAALPYYE